MACFVSFVLCGENKKRKNLLTWRISLKSDYLAFDVRDIDIVGTFIK